MLDRTNLRETTPVSADDGPPKRAGALMHIMRANYFEPLLRLNWSELKETFTLRESSFYPILDWCVTEAFQDILSEQDITVAGHYSYDEGRIAYESIAAPGVQLLRQHIASSVIRYWRNCEIKIMVLPTEVIIARPSPDAYF